MKLFGWLVILSAIQVVESTGVLKLKMKTFNNPKHKTQLGHCCDTITLCHKNPCDNYFKKICLTAPRALACGLGSTATGVIRENSDSIAFGSTIGSVSNPIVYSFRRWEGSFKLEIEIWDKDMEKWRGKDDLILRGEENIDIFTSQEENSTATEVQFTNRFSKLVLEVRVYCNKGYLPPSCEEYCSPSNDSTGHYMCDFVNGKKVCFDHWYGDNCTKPCLAHDDAMGHYVCDNKTGDIICLPGWRNESINCTDGSTSLVHRSTTGLEEALKPSFALKAAVLDVMPTTSLIGSVPFNINVSLEKVESFASVEPENSNIRRTSLPSTTSSVQWFTISKIQSTKNKMGSSKVDINTKHTDIIHYQTTASISNKIEAASTIYKATSADYSNKFSTKRLNYRTSSCCVTQSTIGRMSVKPMLSVIHTKWPIAQSTESFEITKANEIKTLEKSFPKSKSSNMESQVTSHSTTSTLCISTQSSTSALDSKYISTASSIYYSPLSSILEYRYKLEEFRFNMQIELSDNQLAKSFDHALKNEICRSVRKLCEYRFGCDVLSTGLRPELKVGRKKNHGKEVTVRLKFRDFVRAGDRQDAEHSLLKAVLDASRQLEISMFLKIIKVVVVKRNEGESKEDTLPDLKEDNPDFRDASKLLVPMVTGNVVIITILMLVVKLLWQRKVTRKIRPSPLPKEGDTAGNRRIRRTKDADTRGHMNKNRKDMMGMQNEMNFKTPKMSENYNKQMQVDIEDKHLETFFL